MYLSHPANSADTNILELMFVLSRSCQVHSPFLPFITFVQDTEQNGHDAQETQLDEQAVEGHEDGQEEPVVVDADSTDSAVLVNGSEAEEEWGTNNEGKPSA